MKFNIIVAVDECFGIGRNNTLPWTLKEDMKYFKKITSTTIDPNKRNAVIMGRKTWESIPEKYRPLADRYNIVLTSDKNYVAEGAVVCETVGYALLQADKFLVETTFVIGGGEVYREFLNHPSLDKIYITYINRNFNCDTFFPLLLELSKFEVVSDSETFIQGDLSFKFSILRKV